MAFVKLNEDKRGGSTYIDPEKVEGYIIDRETFGWIVRLYAGGKGYNLHSPQEGSDYFKTPEEAQEYLESWFTSVMGAVEELKRRRNSTHFVGRDPQRGDIFRILDNYWEVTGREPGPKQPMITIEVMVDDKGEYDGRYYSGPKIITRSRLWFTEDNEVEFIGNRDDITQTIEQLIGRWKYVEPYVQNFLDGFTGREEIVVHYGDEASGQVYCCDREFKFYKGHAFTHDPDRVTCPEYIRVTHYANARDNQTRCCGKKYPLSVGETWTENANNVNCPEFLKNQASEQHEMQKCNDTEVHTHHTWSVDDVWFYCDGREEFPADAVTSSGDQEA